MLDIRSRPHHVVMAQGLYLLFQADAAIGEVEHADNIPFTAMAAFEFVSDFGDDDDGRQVTHRLTPATLRHHCQL